MLSIMSLPALPGELVLEVARHLPGQEDVSRLCRVNRRFNRLLSDGLYKYDV